MIILYPLKIHNRTVFGFKNMSHFSDFFLKPFLMMICSFTNLTEFPIMSRFGVAFRGLRMIHIRQKARQEGHEGEKHVEDYQTDHEQKRRITSEKNI